ncbi:hypothetical protein HD806DRAFT_535728 [Xylariaceae sp. AK1471]|nr:hypothetical protein HD806DRAFT_535728 [Xylariaceae sp. AK1471]
MYRLGSRALPAGIRLRPTRIPPSAAPIAMIQPRGSPICQSIKLEAEPRPGDRRGMFLQSTKRPDWAHIPLPSTSTPQAKSNPQEKSADSEYPRGSYGHYLRSVESRPAERIYLQDVRGQGPLFEKTKHELDTDPERAKRQWNEMCVQHDLKQRALHALWAEHVALEKRCIDAEARYKKVLAELALLPRKREADTGRLYAELEHIKDRMLALKIKVTRQEKELGQFRLLQRHRWEEAEVKSNTEVGEQKEEWRRWQKAWPDWVDTYVSFSALFASSIAVCTLMMIISYS